jgi:hypothetical protein
MREDVEVPRDIDRFGRKTLQLELAQAFAIRGTEGHLIAGVPEFQPYRPEQMVGREIHCA